MKKILLLALFAPMILSVGNLSAQIRSDYRQETGKWEHVGPRIDSRFFTLYTDEARRIADNIILYQLDSGSWPKNVYFPAELTAEQQAEIATGKKNVENGTIDNGATTTEIIYLSKVYNVTREEKYKEAALKGLDYILAAQYENGGWPQFYPDAQGYARHITFNDNAMTNVMMLLKDLYECNPLYWYVPQSMREKAKTAFDKGVECILATQVVQDGKPTVWCAQHDFETLVPVKARSYELPSLSGAESIKIVQLLMSIPNPSQEVIAAVENAVAWFEKSKITDIRLERYLNEEGKRDLRVVPCDNCQPLWARFYELDTNRPFFSDRDGIKKYNLSEIGYERRNGYSWYNNNGTALIEQYKRWRQETLGEKPSLREWVNSRTNNDGASEGNRPDRPQRGDRNGNAPLPPQR